MASLVERMTSMTGQDDAAPASLEGESTDTPVDKPLGNLACFVMMTPSMIMTFLNNPELLHIDDTACGNKCVTPPPHLHQPLALSFCCPTSVATWPSLSPSLPRSLLLWGQISSNSP